MKALRPSSGSQTQVKGRFPSIVSWIRRHSKKKTTKPAGRQAWHRQMWTALIQAMFLKLRRWQTKRWHGSRRGLWEENGLQWERERDAKEVRGEKMRKLTIHVSVKLEKSAIQKHVSLFSHLYMFIIVCTCIHTYTHNIHEHTHLHITYIQTHAHINTHTYTHRHTLHLHRWKHAQRHNTNQKKIGM